MEENSKTYMHSESFFLPIRPLDIERYGLYTALILAYLRNALGFYGNGGNRFYKTQTEIAETLGLSLKTLRKHFPTEEMGWRHFSAYKPGTMEKTTWWEKIAPECQPLIDSDRDNQRKGKFPLSTEKVNLPVQLLNKNILKESILAAPERALLTETYPTTLNKEKENSHSSLSQPEGCGDVVPTRQADACCKNYNTTPVTDDVPFGDDVQVSVESVNVKEIADAERRRKYALVNDLLKEMGVADKVKPGPKLMKALEARIKQGYGEIELHRVAKLARANKERDPIYSNPIFVFSEAGFAQLLTLQQKELKKRINWKKIV